MEQVRSSLEQTEKGKVSNAAANYKRVLQLDPLLKGAIRKNLLTERVDIVKPLGWYRDSPTLTDVDIKYLLLYFEENYGLTIEKKIQDAVMVIANENRYHPVRDFLNALQWDGTERIRYCLHRFLGADADDYTCEAMRLFLLGAISRAFRPGCKFEIMLCLVGGQGAGKSSFFRLLAVQDDWFSDDLKKLDDENVYAHEHGELEQYRASRKANIACAAAIDAAISEHYRDNCLGREAVSQVVEQFGYDRTLYVLANTVRHKEHDGRISRDNKTWARTIPIYEDPDAWGNDRNVEFVVDGHNPGLVDLFINAARHEYLLTQPLTKDDIRAEAARILSAFQAAREPNSPSGTHFMVQVSPDFLARANSKNQNRLVSMLPFRSLSISTLEGRKGVYVLITKDEDRAQSLRLRKPSVRKKLSETKAEPGHTDKKKVREQER